MILRYTLHGLIQLEILMPQNAIIFMDGWYQSSFELYAIKITLVPFTKNGN